MVCPDGEADESPCQTRSEEWEGIEMVGTRKEGRISIEI
jgi:hypothetical protein